MNKLYIDTSDNKKTIVSLLGEKIDCLKKSSKDHKSQEVLPMICELLQKNNLSIDQIDEIEVNTGPGSYTGLRVGIAIANALGFSKDISVNGKKIGEYVSPKYT